MGLQFIKGKSWVLIEFLIVISLGTCKHGTALMYAIGSRVLTSFHYKWALETWHKFSYKVTYFSDLSRKSGSITTTSFPKEAQSLCGYQKNALFFFAPQQYGNQARKQMCSWLPNWFIVAVTMNDFLLWELNVTVMIRGGILVSLHC